MNNSSLITRILVTLATLAVAIIVGWQLWDYYMLAPWTRDGRVRADVVALAPDVSGPVVQVFVHDNDTVQVGEPLFQIDPARFTLALEQAQASANGAHASMEDAQRIAARYASLSSNAASAQTRDTANAQSLVAQAAYQLAQANLGVAQLNLDRSTVRATVNGTVTNFSMRPGDFVNTGTAVVAIVDTDSLYVDGYFEETKLRRIALGDAATVTLLQGGPAIRGHVAGFAAGIADAERISTTGTLLADVTPTFTWVRLAARVPVRITLDKVPDGIRLVAGMTCTVSITPSNR
jgi:RND family efflux transporter MFP subunit